MRRGCRGTAGQRDRPRKARAVLPLQERKCGFFCWADGGEVFQRGGSSEKLDWSRMPIALNIVSDFGFRAEDLRQGGVGDCWFMSALAVVAERHDLIAKIFGADTARNKAGLYCLRLFMDGKWASVWISDELPVTESQDARPSPSTQSSPFAGAARRREEQQLWASLVEKAYAKCHGSYQSISGGWVAEALLDLTGARRDLLGRRALRFGTLLGSGFARAVRRSTNGLRDKQCRRAAPTSRRWASSVGMRTRSWMCAKLSRRLRRR